LLRRAVSCGETGTEERDMKIRIDEFRTDVAGEVEAPLDFATLCAALAATQATTPTARVARNGKAVVGQLDQVHPAIAALRAVAGHEPAIGKTHGSFHAAAAARFNERPPKR
jgi:hypothetical protein